MNVLGMMAAAGVERSLSMCESSFDLQFSLSDTCDDENAVIIWCLEPVLIETLKCVYSTADDLC